MMLFENLYVEIIKSDVATIWITFNRELSSVEQHDLIPVLLNEIQNRIDYKYHQHLLDKKVGEQ